MKNKSIIKNSIIYIIPITVLFFNVLIILFPGQIILSAKNGLLLWFNNVIPSLLPFIIGANILMITGFTELIGTALKPISQKLFKISGYGVFALVMGFISGYPMGAKITASLYENKKINSDEAQKLIMFTNNSGPLFILGTVSISMFQIPETGILLILSHYLSALTIGVILRNYKASSYNSNEAYSLKKSIRKMRTEYTDKNLTLGSILSKSIKDAMETIFIIGGFIILFSVLSKMLEITEISEVSKKFFTPVFNLLNINTDFIFPLTTGILEITNGCKKISELPVDITTIAITSGIISWGGFSIHAQAIGFLTKTKIKTSLYFLSKGAQSLLSALYVYILNIMMDINFSKSTVETFVQTKSSILNKFAVSSVNFVFVIIILTIISFIVYISHLILKNIKKNK